MVRTASADPQMLPGRPLEAGSPAGSGQEKVPQAAAHERREARGFAPFARLDAYAQTRYFSVISTLRHVTGEESTIDVVVCPYGRNFTTMRSKCSIDVTPTFSTKLSVPVTR